MGFFGDLLESGIEKLSDAKETLEEKIDDAKDWVEYADWDTKKEDIKNAAAKAGRFTVKAAKFIAQRYVDGMASTGYVDGMASTANAHYASYDSEKEYVESNRSRYENGEMSEHERAMYKSMKCSTRAVEAMRAKHERNLRKAERLRRSIERKQSSGEDTYDDVLELDKLQKEIMDHERDLERWDPGYLSSFFSE
ncbi:MAG: hypothetical protein IKP75_06770 [Oscillospiraceae bacterium]|nr:hypothetical protein [Oscillospiraceae bacterium]